ncbi:Hypothetical protein ACI5QL_01379 [Bacillus velezensis]
MKKRWAIGVIAVVSFALMGCTANEQAGTEPGKAKEQGVKRCCGSITKMSRPHLIRRSDLIMFPGSR